jgi:hypothetical protein
MKYENILSHNNFDKQQGKYNDVPACAQIYCAVLVSTVRLGVQFRRPKATSPPQELEVRAALTSSTHIRAGNFWRMKEKKEEHGLTMFFYGSHEFPVL